VKIITTINLEKYLPIGHCIVLIEFSEKEIENFYLKVGENVKRLRKAKNISQMQLALAIGHNSVGHVAKAELCKYDKHFSLEQLYKISRILKVSLHELLPE
jgi:putative transcriptional regulator